MHRVRDYHLHAAIVTGEALAVAACAFACGGKQLAEPPTSPSIDAGGTSSQCVPTSGTVVLAAHRVYPERIVARDGVVYWADRSSADITDGSGIFAIARSGGSVSPLAVPPFASQPGDFAIQGDSIYWLNGIGGPYQGAVMRVATGGGTPQLIAQPAAVGGVEAIAVDASYAYSTDWYGNQIYRTRIEGGAPELFAVTGVGPSSLALDDAYLYVTTAGSDPNFPNEPYRHGTVAKYPLAGGPPIMIASDQTIPLSLRIDASGVYWINVGDGRDPSGSDANGSVFRYSPGDAAPVRLATQLFGPSDLALDGTFAYWPEPAGLFRKVPKVGGSVSQVIRAHPDSHGHAGGVGIAVDECYLYWATGEADGSIMLTSK